METTHHSNIPIDHFKKDLGQLIFQFLMLNDDTDWKWYGKVSDYLNIFGTSPINIKEETFGDFELALFHFLSGRMVGPVSREICNFLAEHEDYLNEAKEKHVVLPIFLDNGRVTDTVQRLACAILDHSSQ